MFINYSEEHKYSPVVGSRPQTPLQLHTFNFLDLNSPLTTVFRYTGMLVFLSKVTALGQWENLTGGQETFTSAHRLTTSSKAFAILFICFN